MPLLFLQNLPVPPEPTLWEHAPGQFLAWNEFGDPNGEPVLYYHGWPSSRLQARLAHHLAKERGLRLVAVDRPGLAKSTFIPHRTLDQWPPLMARFADHLGLETFGQLGISGGGPYVLACAAKIPQRLTASAVLAGMVPLPLTTHGRTGLHPIYRALIPLRKLPSPLFTLAFRVSAKTCQTRPDHFPLKLVIKSLAAEDRSIIHQNQELWQVLTESYSEGILSPSGSQGAMTDAEIYLQKPDFDLQKITHPIHFWHGEDDKNIPATLVRQLAQTMPSAALHLEKNLGHFSLAIHRAAAALDWLSSAKD